ncbi:MAG TPA: tRNA lysidine(34) synthetase TilS [Candidatus Sulfotelmatobacter sp.]|nr:tRNA lysidine(34) synthetase TilS [Candidatus Sulfotelmatobacter sp.]
MPRRSATKTLPALPGLRSPESGIKILVAVSGGLDSMVLLHALKTPAVARRWKLAVAHFNHSLRGRASDADEAFVRKTTESMKLPFFSSSADVKQVARQEKISIEMAARRLRHEFLARTAREHGANTIALAHHADDQVELFFLRLLRGAGGSGLGGMQWRSPSPVDKRISLVRPLLVVPRSALEAFARENRVRYREDATNHSVDFLRNRVRHELLPLLRRHYQPGLNKTILRFMDIAAAESNLIAALARAWLSRQAFWSGKEGGGAQGSSYIKADFESLPEAIQRQVLRLQMIQLEVTPDFELVESIRRSADKPVAVGARVSLVRDATGCVRRCERQTAAFNDRSVAARLNKSGRVEFDGVELNWRLGIPRKTFGKVKRADGLEFFDADKAGPEIVLRHWRAGDRFRPIGLASDAKLQDLFTNARIPRQTRHQLVVAEAGSRIFWVEGLRISEDFKLTAKTQRALIWKWRRHEQL